MKDKANSYNICKECYLKFNKVINEMSKNYENLEIKLKSLKNFDLTNKKGSLEETYTNSSFFQNSFAKTLVSFFEKMKEDIKLGLISELEQKIDNFLEKIKEESIPSMKRVFSILEQNLTKKDSFQKKSFVNRENQHKIKDEEMIPLKSLEEKKSTKKLRNLIENLRNEEDVDYINNFESIENFESNALKSLTKNKYKLNFDIGQSQTSLSNLNILNSNRNSSNRIMPLNIPKASEYGKSRPKTSRPRKNSFIQTNIKPKDKTEYNKSCKSIISKSKSKSKNKKFDSLMDTSKKIKSKQHIKK
jgi:hypothetical protein